MAKKQDVRGKRTAARAANSRRRVRRRTGRRTIHFTAFLLFVLAAGVVLSLTTFFRIEAVYVVGTDKYSPEQVAADSGIELEQNLLRVSRGQVEQRLLEKYPYIASVELRRKLPPAVEIVVTQSVPAIAALEGDDVVLLTREGKVLERGRVLIPPDVLAVQGLPTAGTAPGQLLGEASADGLVMVNYLLDAVENTGFQNITNVDITDPLNMLIVYENRLLLKMGTEADLEHKLVFIQAALADMKPDEEGRIDVSNARTKKWLIVKSISLEEALALEKRDKPEQQAPAAAPENPVSDGDSGEDGGVSGNSSE